MMSEFYIIDAIKNAITVEALEVVEGWINKSKSMSAPMLADMALIKKCELLSERYSETE